MQAYNLNVPTFVHSRPQKYIFDYKWIFINIVNLTSVGNSFHCESLFRGFLLLFANYNVIFYVRCDSFT